MNREALLIVFPALAAFIIPGVSVRKKYFGRTISCIAFLAGALYTAYLMPTVLNGSRPVIIGAWRPPFGINLFIGPFSLTVVLIIYSAALLTMAGGYGSGIKHRGQYYLLYNLVVLSAVGMVLTADLFNLFVFLEISGIASFALISEGSDGAFGSLKYLIQAQVVGLLMLGGVALVYSASGVLSFAFIALSEGFNRSFAFLTILMILLPLLLEAKLFPFHTWVGEAYGDASPAFGGTMSAVTATAAVAVLARLFSLFAAGPSPFLPAGERISSLLLILAAATVLLGEIAAFREKNIKRILAFSSVGQMGMITAGITVLPSGSAAGIVFLLISHSAAKLLLFLTAGYMTRAVGSEDIEDLKGIARLRPSVGVLFTVGALTIMGIPLFAGFWGKLELIRLFAALGGRAFIALGAILIGTVFEGVYLMKISHGLFEESERTEKPGMNISFLISAVILALVVISLGVYPHVVLPWIERAAGDLAGSDYIRIILSSGGR